MLWRPSGQTAPVEGGKELTFQYHDRSCLSCWGLVASSCILYRPQKCHPGCMDICGAKHVGCYTDEGICNVHMEWADYQCIMLVWRQRPQRGTRQQSLPSPHVPNGVFCSRKNTPSHLTQRDQQLPSGQRWGGSQLHKLGRIFCLCTIIFLYIYLI